LELNLNWDIFKPKAPPLFGMDISSSSVKLVELADAGKGSPRVERYAIEALPKDAVLDGNITNLDAVVDAVQRGWKRMGTRTKNVALALPTAAVITKKIIVAAGLREEELETQVESEANQYIPFALDEVSLDFQVLGAIPNAPDDVEVLLGGVHHLENDAALAGEADAACTQGILQMALGSGRVNAFAGGDAVRGSRRHGASPREMSGHEQEYTKAVVSGEWGEKRESGTVEECKSGKAKPHKVSV